jgi:hypothetical protein
MTYQFLSATAAYGHPSGLWLWEWGPVSKRPVIVFLGVPRRPRTRVISDQTTRRLQQRDRGKTRMV